MNQEQAREIENLQREERKMTVSNIRRSLGAMLIAIVFLALFNSAGFTTYARDLPGNAFSDWLVTVADQWNDLLTAAGLTMVIEEVREVFLSLKETEW